MTAWWFCMLRQIVVGQLDELTLYGLFLPVKAWPPV
nr:hypothetical protein pPsy0462b_00029 [Pseudomonas syringae]